MDIYLDFIFSAFLLFALMATYEFGTTAVDFRSRKIEVGVLGLAIGLMTVIILSNPVHVDKGIFVDARWVLLSLAAIFLNWRIVVIGGVIAAAYRYYQGGAGAFPGVMTVISAVGAGFLWRYLLLRFNVEFRWYLHYLFALGVEALIIYVIYLFIPGGKGPIVAGIIAQPLLTLFPIVSIMLSLTMQHHWKLKVQAFD